MKQSLSWNNKIRRQEEDFLGHNPPPYHRVSVIRAVIYGLMAVWELTSRGLPVLLLEAKDQAGGRAWSDPFSFSDAMNGDMGAKYEMVERGGAFIHDGSPNNSSGWLTT